MIVIDHVQQRTLRTRERQAFFDRDDIVTPAVNNDGGTRSDCGRGRQAGQIEGRRHQEKARRAERAGCGCGKESTEARAHQNRLRRQVSADLEQLRQSALHRVDAAIIDRLDPATAIAGYGSQRKDLCSPGLGILAVGKDDSSLRGWVGHVGKCTCSAWAGMPGINDCARGARAQT